MSQGERSALEQAIADLEQYVEKVPNVGDGAGRIPPGFLTPIELRTILGTISEELANTSEGNADKRITGLHALSQFMLTWKSEVDTTYGSVIKFERSDLKSLADKLRALLPI